jgi:hypothetical protein
MATTRERMALVMAAVSFTACYRPNIKDGGLHCTEGGLCPDGYHCGADRRCHPGPSTMCLPDAGVVTPICSDQPLGDQCDPICQQGCDCGRCNLVGNTLRCVAYGSKTRGAFCNLAADDCAPGHVCLRELCSPADAGVDSDLGRCYRYCAGNNHCDGTLCNVPIFTDTNMQSALLACQSPPQACDPVGDTDTCGNPLLGCYVESNGRRFCECKGVAGAGEVCGVFSDCVPGFRCVQQGAPPARCRQVCRLGTADCGAGGTCMSAAGDPTFGYCGA